MGFGFLDGVTFLAIQESRDRKREKQREMECKKDQEKESQDIYQKCNKKISNASSNLFGVVVNVFEQANQKNASSEVVRGCLTLPFYAFMKVLQVEENSVTSEQIILLDIFFKSIKGANISKNDFFAAVKSNTQVRKDIEALVGISENYAGLLWKQFFKALYVTCNNDNSLEKVIEFYCTIVQMFSILGRQESKIADQICTDFKKSALYQFEACRNLPEDDLYSLSKVSLTEHLKQMKVIVMSLKERISATEEDSPDIETLFPLFVCGILFDLVSMSHCEESIKADILNRAIELSPIDGYLSGYEVMEDMAKGIGAAELITFLKKTEGEKLGFWGLVFLMGNRTNLDDDALKFFNECLSYMIDIESVLKQEYPNVGLGDYAQKYMLDKISKVSNLLSDN